MQISPGQYWQCIQPDDSFAQGDLVLVTSVVGDEVSFTYLDSSWHSRVPDFLQQFEFDPEGEAKRTAQLSQLMQDSTSSNQEQAQLTTTLLSLSTSTDLARVNQAPAAVRKQVGMFKGQLVKLQQSMVARQKKMEALLHEKKQFMLAKQKQLEQIVGRVEEALLGINLYIGSQEEIYTLTEGPSSPPDTKVTIRQQTLFMDEEAAVFAERGGLDFQQIGVFDKWISDPTHPERLQQVFPEPKGVVALHVRRNSKEYSDDPWTNAAMNEENHKTYFLIRNGANLYRIYAPIQVGATLFPRQDEFEDVLGPSYNYRGEPQEQAPLRPGSKEYVEKMDQVDARCRHYMRVILFLQGLFDRTKVFVPYGDIVNLATRQGQDSVLYFLHDAEMLLPSGRPPFTDWLKQLNSKLVVGARIVGVFNSYHSHSTVRAQYERSSRTVTDPGRLEPISAPPPVDNQLYHLDERHKDGFRFFYDRTDEVWDRSSRRYRAPEKRAACTVYPDDDFIINFDDLDPADIDFYLHSRVDRHAYIYMFPLLRVAMEMKQKELTQEAPYRALIAQALVNTYHIFPTLVAEAVPALVQWWKFKCKITRALNSNDQKSFPEMVQQYSVWASRAQELEKRRAQVEPLLSHIRQAEPNVVLIAHKTDNQYVALVAANSQNIFVHEQIWRYGRGHNIERLEVRVWRLVDKRREGWRILWTSPRWATWDLRKQLSEVLTDPEIKQVTQLAWARIEEHASKAQRRYRWGQCTTGDDDESAPPLPELPFLRLAAAVYQDQSLHLFYLPARFALQVNHPMRVDNDSLQINDATISWQRTLTGFQVRVNNTSHWQVGHKSWLDLERHPNLRVVECYSINVATLDKEISELHTIQQRAADLREQIDSAWDAITQRWLKEEIDRAHAKFVEENDPDLWPQEKEKKFRAYYYDHRDVLRELLTLLVEAGLNPTNQPLSWAWTQAKPLSNKDFQTLLPGLEGEWIMASLKEQPIA